MKHGTGKSNLSIIQDYLDGVRPFIQVGYDAPWTIISANEAYEEVKSCRINDTTPAQYKGKGIPFYRCKGMTQAFYPKLVPGTKMELSGGLCRGQGYCHFHFKPI